MLATANKIEYTNDFISFVITPGEHAGREALTLSFGINLSRFRPITSGQYGISCNPILSGFKLLKFDLCGFARAKGATPHDSSERHSLQIVPSEDAWHIETLQVDDSREVSAEELLDFGIKRFIQKVITSSRRDFQAPERLLSPRELQAYFETLCRSM